MGNIIMYLIYNVNNAPLDVTNVKVELNVPVK